MTDIDLMQDHIRAANPIPRVDDLDTDELAAFIATAHTRRSAIMQTPTQHKPQPATTAPTARRRVWAFAAGFVAVLLVIGITTLVLRGGDTPMANEPATPTTVTEPEVPTTVGVEQATPVAPGSDALSDGWQQVAVDEPWIMGIVDVDALPGDGFFVAALRPWALRWSPNGVEWFDADPQKLLSAEDLRHDLSDTPFFENELSQAMWGKYEPVAVVGDRVVILSRDKIGVWVGDPAAGSWELIRLGTAGMETEPRLLGVAASDMHAMVVGETSPGETAAWLIDVTTGTSQWHPLPTPEYDRPFWAWPGGNPDNVGEWARVEWFNGRWLVMPSCGYCPTVYVSTDGANWVESEVTWAADAPPLPGWSIEDDGAREGFWPGDSWANCDIMDMTVGPGMVILSSFAHPHAHSADGLTWFASAIPDPYGLEVRSNAEWTHLTYSGALGYVTREHDPNYMTSVDGKTWQLANRPPANPDALDVDTAHLTASGSRMLLLDYGAPRSIDFDRAYTATLQLWSATR